MTLDICTALIKKCFRDLALFASNIVSILDAVVKDSELVLVEHSVLTLKAFCTYHDGKLLTLSQQYRNAFQTLCRGYASYGINQEDMRYLDTSTSELILRAQYASLEALQALISSEAFQSTTAGGQIKIIIPAIVQILAHSSVNLHILRQKTSEEVLSPRERRQSFFSREPTGATQTQSGTPRSSMQVDFTEEANCVLALKNLKQVFEMNNGSLIRISLDCLINKLASMDSCNSTDDYPGWTVGLVTFVLKWLPIQHRYLIVVASLEDLEWGGRRAISTPKQELLVTILEGVLTTGESLIGLNVMDVLNQLIEQIAIQLTVRPVTSTDVVQKLTDCIVGLSTHVYYADQIRDMCSGLMEWSRPLFAALNRVSGKDSPTTIGDDESLDVKTAAIWSLRVLKGILNRGGGSVGLEEVWTGTEGGLAGREGDVRMEYVDALTTHIRCETEEEDGKPRKENVNSKSLARFLSMIHVPMFHALKKDDSTATDYWAIWVLSLVLLERFEVKEVVKALPMKFRLLEIAQSKATHDQRAAIEGCFLGFLFVVSESFKIPSLKASVAKEIEYRRGQNAWPSFIDPSVNPATITLQDISASALVLPSPTDSLRPLPTELQRTALISTLAFSNAFPESLREHLLVPWSEETLMPDQLSYTPESHSEAGHHMRSVSRQTDAKSLSAQSRSVEESQGSPLVARRRSLSKRNEAAPSAITQIDDLRQIIAGVSPPASPTSANIPQIEVNGEKVPPPDEESELLTEEKELEGNGDVRSILESLRINAEWHEKAGNDLNQKVEGGIRPPYVIEHRTPSAISDWY